jgi:hypothetical protein
MCPVCLCARSLMRACLRAYAFIAHTPRTCTCDDVDRVMEEEADRERETNRWGAGEDSQP